MTRTLLIDARCLQHPGYATRGIGRHIETMLRAMPDALRHRFRVMALVDPALPPLTEAAAALFSRLTTTSYAARQAAGSVFLNPAPLSFSPLPVAALLRAPGVICAAVVLDFIPLDYPELYLTAPDERRRYKAGLAALRRYDRFLPISHASAARLARISSDAKPAHITGVAVRLSLMPAPDVGSLAFGRRKPEIFIVAGDDPRKNPEIAVRAHGASAALQRAGIRLRFAAIHDRGMQARLAALHAAAGGDPALLGFAPVLDEASLAEAYAYALLVIAPSRAEGFSLPVVEAMAQGTPVLAADEPAQAELVTDDADRFDPDDADALRARMETLALDAVPWQAAAARQSGIWRNFTPEAVAGRFWQPFRDLPAPALLRRARPRIALLSPLPPARSGCADHSAALLATLAESAEVTAFTDAAAPVLPAGITCGGRAGPSVMTSMRFDAVIAVIGNAPLHRTEARLLRDYGGAAIVHDARLGDLYRSGFGDKAALDLATAEYGEAVSYEQLDAWEADQATMPLRFLGEIAAAAAPLIVHAASTAQWVASHHGIAARFLPFTPYRLPDPAALTDAGRLAARTRLGIADEVKLIVTFGHVQPDRAPETLIHAAAALNTAMTFKMAFIGAADPALVARLRALAETLGIDRRSLILDSSLVPEAAYRDYLAAADCAVQLRRAPPGSISGALMDAIAAGLPSVAAMTLAEAIMPPCYVQAVPDDAAAETIAVAIRHGLAQGRGAMRPARDAFLAGRTMTRYAAQLLRTVLH